MFRFLSPVVLLTVAGCATPVKTDYKAGADFSKYRTFAVMPLPQRASAEDPGLVLRVGQPAKQAVVEALTAKGLTEAATDQADLTVALHGKSLPKVEIRDYGYNYPVMTRYGMVSVYQTPYVSASSVSTTTERTLIIELLDNHTKELVWVGWTKKDSSEPVKVEALQEAIRKVLAEYPPKTSSSDKKS
jgi:hypothetical protein